MTIMGEKSMCQIKYVLHLYKVAHAPPFLSLTFVTTKERHRENMFHQGFMSLLDPLVMTFVYNPNNWSQACDVQIA